MQRRLAMALKPLISIVGTTGVGKSKLAIELAHKIAQTPGCDGARIINADSMQIYKGLNVVTNKVTEEEMEGVEHLLMGIREPGEQYMVRQWVEDAVNAIDETHARNQIPIVVGGTAYWMEHLLFPGRLSAQDSSVTSSTTPDKMSEQMESLSKTVALLSKEQRRILEDLPNQSPNVMSEDDALAHHSLLHILDPSVAARWNWRDARKVHRSLGIIKSSGRRVSDMIHEQSQVELAPRYRSLCFWLYAEPDALNPRLDTRVDYMIEQGLLDEIRALRAIANASPRAPTPRLEDPLEDENDLDSNGSTPDYTLGIYQSIGYREFHDYLSSGTDHDQAKFDLAVEDMKHSTRAYATVQIKRIRNKLLPAINSVSEHKTRMSLYLLDATELADQWTANVQAVGERITDDFLHERELPDSHTLNSVASKMLTVAPKPTSPSAVLEARRKVICPICTAGSGGKPVMVEDGALWDEHIHSRPHKSQMRRVTRDEDIARAKVVGIAKREERQRMKADFDGVEAKPLSTGSVSAFLP